MPDAPSSASIPRANPGHALGVLAEVVLPLVARGVVLRRPPVVRAIERFDLDRRAVHRLQRLDERYGPGPVRVEAPGRTFAIVLDADDARRVLHDSPDPFAPATREKRAALEVFQPHGVLASRGSAREERRALNEAVLDADAPIHALADRIHGTVLQETRQLLGTARREGVLTWDAVVQSWYRMVRRVVLGEGAGNDTALTDMLAELRASANWSFLARPRRGLRRRFLARLERHVARAEAGTLAAELDTMPRDDRTAPVQQVPQWLFAFDAAAWTLVRALELVTSDVDALDGVRREVADVDLAAPQLLPFTRACVLDTLRLFPTTPAVLRETVAETTWSSGTLPSGAGILVFAPYFHRDDRVVPQADRFEPLAWKDHVRAGVMEGGDGAPPFLPFSAGPAICPGRHVVLLTVSTALGALVRELDLRPTAPGLDPTDLPSALDPFGARLRVA